MDLFLIEVLANAGVFEFEAETPFVGDPCNADERPLLCEERVEDALAVEEVVAGVAGAETRSAELKDEALLPSKLSSAIERAADDL